ncbi:hypothetical protein BZB76_0979 [Actinomadura pelletieri DSM 43383]|uniref:Uncharacterized protein n=1 Tax=Actinomadura pelletieri DSM 43383 TaxID=1120940 RepID=A0A495QZM9_9ACTN|nr:hypothetical protein BZB76_0979 [Actinomadura pelletieri DSM 43383]
MIAAGEVPFALLEGHGTVMARHVTVRRAQPEHSLSDPVSTSWTLTLDGREFQVTSTDGRNRVPIDSAWARGEEEPMTARDGIVSYDFFYSHHLGWLTGPVRLTFDPDAMIVHVESDLKFEAD